MGGANLAEMIEAASGINLWREWAKVEVANARKQEYQLPPVRKEYGGIAVCLAQQRMARPFRIYGPGNRVEIKEGASRGLDCALERPQAD